MKLRSYLVLLVFATVLPVVLFAGVVTYSSYQQHRERLEQTMIERARAISAALDREFLVSIQSLKVLGASTRLDKEQLGEFYGDMKAALDAYSRAWQNLTLTDATGQQLINLRRPFGAALPTSGNPVALKRALESGDAVIADLSPGPVTGTLAIVVHVPVIRDGRPKYVLNAIFYPAPLTELLLQQKLPEGWIATILDRNQKIVARTQNIEKFSGRPATSTFTAQAKQYQEGSWRDTSSDDSAVVGAHHRSEFTGWTVGLSSPSRELEAPLTRSLILTGAGGLGFLLIALALAAKLGKRIAEPVSALAVDAEKLGGDEIPHALQSPIIEVNRVARAIEDAGSKRAMAASERLRFESSLRESEERFRQLAENIREVFWLSTPDKARIIYVSPGYELIWGRNCQILYNSPRDWLDAIHPDDRSRVLGAALKDQQSGAYDQEFRIVRPDGSIRWIRDRAFPVRDANGEVYRIAGIAEDITARKQAEETLKRSHEDLEEKVAERTRELLDANVRLTELDRVKSQFLANMSHELRTPLNAIIGFSELMHDDKAGGPTSAEQKEYLNDILNSGRHLLHLIDDVLDLSKIEAGRMAVLNSTFHIDEIIIEVIHNIAPVMSAKDLRLTRALPEDLEPITTDRRKFFQILLNLASNAVKFTTHGEIGIRCERVSDTLRVSVSDTGLGIKSQDLPLLFQPFSQIDDSLRKRHVGTGLGLYLSKTLAHLLGGTIMVESEYGKGSTFRLEIPMNPKSAGVRFIMPE